MGYGMDGTKALPKLMLSYCQIDRMEKNKSHFNPIEENAFKMSSAKYRPFCLEVSQLNSTFAKVMQIQSGFRSCLSKILAN